MCSRVDSLNKTFTLFSLKMPSSQTQKQKNALTVTYYFCMLWDSIHKGQQVVLIESEKVDPNREICCVGLDRKICNLFSTTKEVYLAMNLSHKMQMILLIKSNVFLCVNSL